MNNLKIDNYSPCTCYHLKLYHDTALRWCAFGWDDSGQYDKCYCAKFTPDNLNYFKLKYEELKGLL